MQLRTCPTCGSPIFTPGGCTSSWCVAVRVRRAFTKDLKKHRETENKNRDDHKQMR